MRIVVECSCFLETSTHLQEIKLKIVVVLLLSRVERDKHYLERLSIFQLLLLEQGETKTRPKERPNSPPHDNSNYTN
jgi:hypothetical protein